MITRLCVLLCLFYTGAALGQTPVADFTVSDTAGCAPFTVNFKDASGGSPLYWNWDLGNGQLSSTQNPVGTYSQPGTYTVQLVVRNNDGTNGVTKTNIITVYPSPVASFTVDRKNSCLPSSVKFTDLSSNPAGAIASWEWSFGDSTTSTEQNPSHAYSNVGFYTVQLKVTSETGCTSVNGQARFIRILSGVKAEFDNDPTASCTAPFPVAFKNQTSGPGKLSYEWSLGNGSTSTNQTPSTTYATPGDYTVKLKAISDLGCEDSISKTISVSAFTADFNGPDTVCLNSTATFTDASTPTASSINWNIGGQLSTGGSVTKQFTQPGNFTIRMIANFPSCADSITKQLVVNAKPLISYTADKTSFCKAPANVNFTDNTPNAVAWTWDFGDGSSASTRNPSHTYADTGTYTVRLIITDQFGCTDTLQKPGYISVTLPVAQISNLSSGGCIPFTFVPKLNVISNDAVTSYKWDFGNGITSTLANPSVTYVDSGVYSVSVIVMTASGCTDSAVYVNGIRTGKPTSVDFTYTVPGGCTSGGVTFTAATSPDVGNFLWNFGDGSTSTNKNPTHVYTDTGYVTVTLVATRNGCPNTVTKKNLLRINGPIANFDFRFDCATAGQAMFNDRSIPSVGNSPLTYKWSFGDPANSSSTLRNPSFSYTAQGTYTVTLTISDNSCSHSITKAVVYKEIPATFSILNQDVCRNSPFTLKADSTDAQLIASYDWTVGTKQYTGGAVINPTINANGVYDVTLKITNVYGCVTSNTVKSYIRVGGPEALFEVSAPLTCLPAGTTFIDRSPSPGAIKEYTFDFGDGSVQRYPAAPFTHNYADTGSYIVKMAVTDAAGCSAAYTLPVAVKIAGVVAKFNKDTTTFCPGFPVSFIDSSIGTNLTYRWNFGDGSISSDRNPSHTFANNGTYTVSLKVTDANGCSDSLSRANYITIRRPLAGFSVSDSVSLCPPFEVGFQLTGTEYAGFSWDFGDGQTGSLRDERHFYNDYGDYTARLIVNGNGGCVDTTSKIIKVIRPGNIPLTYSPLDSCNQITVDFSITAPPSTKYTFYYGDGKLDNSEQQKFTHQYEQPGTFFPVAVFTDKAGCVVNRGGSLPIRVRGAQPFFGVNKNAFCDTGTVAFTNYTIGNDPVVSYLWNFADNTTSSDKDVIHRFDRAGIYQVSLTVNTASGCTDIFLDTINVYQTPVATIISADSVCVNTSVPFEAQLLETQAAPVTWKWDFGNGRSADFRNPAETFTSAGDYTVRLNTSVPFGCASSTAKTLRVFPTPTISFGSEPVVFSGRSVDLPVTYTGSIVSYNWVPPATLNCSRCDFPTASPKKTTEYQVTVVDSIGCSATGSIIVRVICGDRNLFLPNTFSPNGDGSNERFYPRGNGMFQVRYLRVFNRWGEQVFERTNFAGNQSAQGWDGTFKGKPLPADVYVYTVEVVCENSESFTYKGSIMLVR